MKEPKEVDWSKQKPGTIGVTRDGNRYEFIAARCDSACFHSDRFGWANRHVDGSYNLGAVSKQDILLPWESCIAEGHNPDGLTNAQVGEGWRLIGSPDEAPNASAEFWFQETEWRKRPVAKDNYDKRCTTYRVPITKPKRRVPCGPEHFPPGTILCHNDFPNAWQMVIWVQSHSIGSMDSSGGFVKETYGQIMGFNGQRSTDFGKTWLPCFIETEE